jgi:hypothetical protein
MCVIVLGVKFCCWVFVSKVMGQIMLGFNGVLVLVFDVA